MRVERFVCSNAWCIKVDRTVISIFSLRDYPQTAEQKAIRAERKLRKILGRAQKENTK